MKNQLLLGFSLVVILSQVACSQDDKAAATKYCASNAKDCINRYYRIAGAAATEGESQVGNINAILSQGQVPNTQTLPASVSDAQIQAKAAAVKTALVTTQPAAVNSNGIQTASAGELQQVEVGVTRLQDPAEIGGSTSSSSSVSQPPNVTSTPGLLGPKSDNNVDQMAVGAVR